MKTIQSTYTFSKQEPNDLKSAVLKTFHLTLGCFIFLQTALHANVISFELPHEKQFNQYWYKEGAEISRYSLQQARYGEIRKGDAVLIFVTEPFDTLKQVKADKRTPQSIPVLKLNLTKNFNTGIYPYSIMTSIFQPIDYSKGVLPVKVSTSVQEWCGHVYMQLNYRKKLEIEWRSYFESEGDQKIIIEKTLSEDALFTLLRTHPEKLPLGKVKLIPLSSFLRLNHIMPQAENAELSLSWEDTSKGLVKYTITYSSIERKSEIIFSKSFPYRIESWTESYLDGFGEKAQKLTTKAQRTHTLKSFYWEKNSNSDLPLRNKLGLKP